MTCTDCATASQVDHWGFTAGCKDCCARAMARGPHFFRVKQAGAQDRQYRSALEQFGLTHDEVKAAWAADATNKEKPA